MFLNKPKQTLDINKLTYFVIFKNDSNYNHNKYTSNN